MTSIDADLLRRIKEQTTSQPRPMPARLRTSDALLDNRKQAEQLLQAYAQKAGLPLDQLERLKAERRAEQRRLLNQAAEDGAEYAQRMEAERRAGLQSWRKARTLLSPQTQASIIRVEEPVEVAPLGNQRPIDFSSHIEPLNSFARLNIDTGSDSGHDDVSVVFFFVWQNPNPSTAVIDALTMLRFNGSCRVEADSGFWGGPTNQYAITAHLALIRGAGWGTDANGNPLDGTSVPVFMGTTSQDVSSKTVTGGGLFDPPSIDGEDLHGRPVGLDAEQIIVPGSAFVIFQVMFEVAYVVHDGGDNNFVQILFGNDALVRRVSCPSVTIELLT